MVQNIRKSGGIGKNSCYQQYPLCACCLEEQTPCIASGLRFHLFTTYPQTKVYFKNFKNMDTLEEMQVHPGIQMHGKRVMGALNHVIENLNNWDVVSSALTDLAKRHQDVHEVEVNNFQLLFLVILSVFKEALGAQFTPGHRKSWEKLFSITYNFLDSQYTKSDSK
ncbi:cytoglobin isoform X1 [Xenopus laevis]|uniref:superoxide dismutase n=1 Tax=Xenopus laevis TaxID=8355 RepID=A0A8J0U3Z5_XENLA|nr:cytoglobin isoform X1 [Xenopus laevis]